MSMTTVTYSLGPVRVQVRTSVAAVSRHLDEFYTVSDAPEPAEGTWTIEATDSSPAGTPDKWGVWRSLDRSRRVLRLISNNHEHLAVSARKCLREVFVDHCERRGYAMLHASAVANDSDLIMIVGDKGSGKTTLALRAVLDHGWRYISNDHLIVYPTIDHHNNGAETAQPDGQRHRVEVTSLPTPIPVKVGTYLDIEDRLPPPWDYENLTPDGLDSYRRLTALDRYRSDVRVLYTFRRLGQRNPVSISSEAPPSTGDGRAVDRRVTIVLAGYAKPGATTKLSLVPDPVAALWPHVRFDWMFDPALNQNYLQRAQRDHARYSSDAQDALDALTSNATVVTWSHHGDLAPLLAELDNLGTIR